MQQINFYLDEFKPPVIVLPLYQAVLISMCVLFGTLGLIAYQYHQLNLAEVQYKKTYDTQLALEIEVNQLNETAPTLTKDPQYAQLVTRLTAEHYQKEHMLSLLKADHSHFVMGFSAILNGLSRQIVDGLWLDRIFLDQNGIELQGYVLQSHLLMDYLQNLRAEVSLKGQPLRKVDVTRLKHFDKALKFRVSTQSTQPEG